MVRWQKVALFVHTKQEHSWNWRYTQSMPDRMTPDSREMSARGQNRQNLHEKTHHPSIHIIKRNVFWGLSHGVTVACAGLFWPVHSSMVFSTDTRPSSTPWFKPLESVWFRAISALSFMARERSAPADAQGIWAYISSWDDRHIS